jgi:hypothetical protein
MMPDHPATSIEHIERIPVPHPSANQVGHILCCPALRLATPVSCPAIPPVHVARRMEFVLLPMRPIEINAISLPELLHPEHPIALSPQLIHRIDTNLTHHVIR